MRILRQRKIHKIKKITLKKHQAHIKKRSNIMKKQKMRQKKLNKSKYNRQNKIKRKNRMKSKVLKIIIKQNSKASQMLKKLNKRLKNYQ